MRPYEAKLGFIKLRWDVLKQRKVCCLFFKIKIRVPGRQHGRPSAYDVPMRAKVWYIYGGPLIIPAL